MLYKGFLCDCMEVFMGCFLSLAHANPIWAGYVAQLIVFVFFFRVKFTLRNVYMEKAMPD